MKLFLIKIYMNILNFLEMYFNGELKGLINKENNRISYLSLTKYIPYRWYLPFIDKEKYDYFYYVNNKYYFSNSQIKITPVIKSIKMYNDSDELDVTYISTLYQNTFPLWLVIFLENLENYSRIKVTKDNILTEITTTFDINEYETRQLSYFYNKI